jgi:8-oxo-dGTP pyrophosphatase MutT (NUDIX family)
MLPFLVLIWLAATHAAFNGAGVQIMDGKQVLLVQNLGSGNWGFPKGHREPQDVTWRDTAVREVEEETGLKENIHYSICSEEPDQWGRRPYWTGFAHVRGPLRRNISEHRAVRWVPVAHLKDYHLNYDLAQWFFKGAAVKCTGVKV